MKIQTMCKSAYLALALAGYLIGTAALQPGDALAGEGGGSAYLQGTYGDFQAGVFGPSGFYFRNDLTYYDASLGARPQGGRVAAEIDQTVWLNGFKFAYLTDNKLFGARTGYAITIPLVYADVGAEGSVPEVGVDLFRSGSTSGFADIYLNPLLLNWTSGNNHFTFAPGINIPVGKYDVDNQINLGRNYWALDLAGSWTYFNPSSGFEISATAGVLINDRNPDTEYKTGTEFHLDWNVSQFFSETFGIGLTGYVYDQLSDDDGRLAGGLTADDFDGFRGSGWGLGPAVLKTASVGGTAVNFIAKAIFDIDSKKRVKGDLFMISASLKF